MVVDDAVQVMDRNAFCGQDRGSGSVEGLHVRIKARRHHETGLVVWVWVRGHRGGVDEEKRCPCLLQCLRDLAQQRAVLSDGDQLLVFGQAVQACVIPATRQGQGSACPGW